MKNFTLSIEILNSSYLGIRIEQQQQKNFIPSQKALNIWDECLSILNIHHLLIRGWRMLQIYKKELQNEFLKGKKCHFCLESKVTWINSSHSMDLFQDKLTFNFPILGEVQISLNFWISYWVLILVNQIRICLIFKFFRLRFYLWL